MTEKTPAAASPHPAEQPPHPRPRKPRNPRNPRKLRFVIPLALVAVCVVLAAAVLKNTSSSMTVSEVTRAIRQLALRQGDTTEPRQGGEVGPWWIAADDCDDLLSSEFLNFRLASGSMQVAARRARLQVDPEADTIRFEMWGVVYARVPYTRRREQSDEHFLHEMDHFVLGPAAWGTDIVPDADGADDQLSPLPVEDATTEPE